VSELTKVLYVCTSVSLLSILSIYLTIMSELSSRTLEGFEGLNLSPEAIALLAEQQLVKEDIDSLRFLLAQQTAQAAFWNSDCGASDEEVLQNAREMEVSGDEVRKALVDLSDPVAAAKRQFLNDFVTSDGDVDKLLTAYEYRAESEAQHGAMTFTESDVAPFQLHMIQVFDVVFKQVKSGDARAKEVLRSLLRDFGTVPKADYKAWFARRVAESMPTDLQMYAAKAAIKAHPERFDELVEQFLNGGDVAGLLGV